MRSFTTHLARAALPALVGAALSMVGCSSSISTTVSQISPSLITVTPAAFGGAEPCARMIFRRYVVTLIDVSTPAGAFEPGCAKDAGAAPFVLASSGPTECTRSLAFAYVYPGDQYAARVDGYVRDDIVAYGGEGSGSSIMVDPNGAVVAPDFTTTCGDPPAMTAPGACPDGDAGLVAPRIRTTAVPSTNVFLHDCGMLLPEAAGIEAGLPDGSAGAADADDGSTETGSVSATGAIRVDLAGLLGNATQHCGPDSVETYFVTVSRPDADGAASGAGTVATSPRPTACTDDTVFSPLAADPTPYDILITTTGKNAAGTSGCLFQLDCSAQVLAGQTVEPVCGPLTTCP